MTRFYLILAFVALVMPVCAASTNTTATITITNAVNLTNGAAITYSGDTRTWTNAVTTPSSQIQSETNINSAASRLLTHLSSYPFSGLSLSASGTTGVNLRAPLNAGLTITLTGTNWGTVTYTVTTNTPAIFVQVPISALPAAAQTNTASGLADAINSAANTNGVAASKLTGTVPLASLSGITTNEVDASFQSMLGGGLSAVAVTNCVFVSKNGNDSTGARGDLSKPFLTPGAAKTNAASGDTIFVFPGVYNDSNLLKDGVNWHFFNGAVVTNTSGSFALFDGQAAGVTSKISGEGTFLDSGSYGVMILENAGCNIDFAFKTCAGGNPCIGAGKGTLTLAGDLITGSAGNQALLIDDTNSVVTVNRTKITHTGTGANKAAVKLLAVNNGLTFRDCLLISGASATNSINASSAVTVQVYGTLNANLPAGPNVTFGYAANRFP